MVWVFVVLAVLATFAIAAVTVGREAFRLGHQPPPTIFDLDEAVEAVADALPPEAQARLTYDEVRSLVAAELERLRAKGVFALPGEEVAGPAEGQVVVADDEAVAQAFGAGEAAGLDVTDEDVFRVVSALYAHLAAIGAVGPEAAGGGADGNGDQPGGAPG